MHITPLMKRNAAHRKQYVLKSHKAACHAMQKLCSMPEGPEQGQITPVQACARADAQYHMTTATGHQPRTCSKRVP